MEKPWDAERVTALAPDAASVAAARRVAVGAMSRAGWSREPAAVWGLLPGSGRTPYATVVDLAEEAAPGYRCTCPSRKFPCKHALGLLLAWSAGALPEGPPAPFAEGWLVERAERAERSAERAAARVPRPKGELADPEAARKRAEQRAARVASGLDELDRWLRDQVRSGLAAAASGGYELFEQPAARLVDAQAPAVASALRRLPGVVASGEGWPGRLLEEYGRLRLLVAAHRRLAELPPEVASTVRTRVGYPVAKDGVLASPGVPDRWAVLSVRDEEDERLTIRRASLRGTGTGRPALVISYAGPGQELDASLAPGALLDATLHFYPGAAPLRALVGERRGEVLAVPPGAVPGGPVAAALAEHAAALTADPWLWSWPVVLTDVVPVPGNPWHVVDLDGAALALTDAAADLWRLLAVSGGHPVTVTGDVSPAGLVPWSVVGDEGLVSL